MIHNELITGRKQLLADMTPVVEAKDWAAMRAFNGRLHTFFAGTESGWDVRSYSLQLSIGESRSERIQASDITRMLANMPYVMADLVKLSRIKEENDALYASVTESMRRAVTA